MTVWENPKIFIILKAFILVDSYCQIKFCNDIYHLELFCFKFLIGVFFLEINYFPIQKLALLTPSHLYLVSSIFCSTYIYPLDFLYPCTVITICVSKLFFIKIHQRMVTLKTPRAWTANLFTANCNPAFCFNIVAFVTKFNLNHFCFNL